MSRSRIRRLLALTLCCAAAGVLVGCDATTVQDAGSAPGGRVGGNAQQTSLTSDLRTAYQTASLIRIESGSYPIRGEMASRLMESEPGLVFIPLAKATMIPGRPEVIGVWTDGTDHLVLSARTPSGRTLRLDARGDDVTTNF